MTVHARTTSRQQSLESIAPHPHGNPMRRDPIPAVLQRMRSPLPQFPHSYCGIPAVPITVQTSTVDTAE